MKTLDLHKIWSILNTICEEQDNLSEQEIYVNLLGQQSNYIQMSFNGFLSYYSFKIDKDVLCVFNDDGVPYESFSNNDFSYLPTILLNYTDDELNTWIKAETEKQLNRQKEEKLQEIENKKLLIQRLQKEIEE